MTRIFAAPNPQAPVAPTAARFLHPRGGTVLLAIAAHATIAPSSPHPGAASPSIRFLGICMVFGRWCSWLRSPRVHGRQLRRRDGRRVRSRTILAALVA